MALPLPRRLPRFQCITLLVLCTTATLATATPRCHGHSLFRPRRPRWFAFLEKWPRGGASTTFPSSPVTMNEQQQEQQHQETSPTTNETNSSSSSSSSSSVGTVVGSLPKWKQALPEVLQRKGPKTLQKINWRPGAGAGGTTTATTTTTTTVGAEIYLLGTAHVSNDSSADVKCLLEAVQPDCIFVELCDARVALLDGGSEDSDSHNNETKKKTSVWDRLDQIRQSQGGSRAQALGTLLLTSVQEDYAQTLGVELGGEFRTAYHYWKARQQPPPRPPVSGATNDDATNAFAARSIHPSLILGDRPLSLTLVRAWESLSWWWPKLQILAGLMWSSWWQKPDPEELRAWLESVLRDESDVLTESLLELQKHFPSLYQTIIAERDAWLACKLVQCCRILTGMAVTTQNHARRKPRIVAIVGAGHVPGIVRWLTQNSTRTVSPEQVLRNLTTTRRWANDATVQQEMIPVWVYQVTQVHHYFGIINNNNNDKGEWSWAEPSTETPP